MILFEIVFGDSGFCDSCLSKLDRFSASKDGRWDIRRRFEASDFVESVVFRVWL